MLKVISLPVSVPVADTNAMSAMYSGVHLLFNDLRQEGRDLRGRPADRLTAIEKEVIAEIRVLMSSTEGSSDSALLENPPRLARHFILASHGSVQLRFSAIARGLGVEMRTLERAFAVEYKMTMAQFQVETRLKFSLWLLSIYPPTKISAIAAMLGYRLVQDFNRFFKKHMHQSPAEWARRERSRIAATGEATRDE